MKNKMILVADDWEEWTAIHRERLEEAGYSVHVVYSGREVAAVLQSDQDFDGAVLDNNMPPGDFGLMILNNIRQGVYGDRRRQMPVLVCASYDQSVQSTAEALEAKYIDKNAAKAQYLKVVKELFDS